MVLQIRTRQWNLVDNKELCYHWLGDFDSAMVHLLESVKNIQKSDVVEIWHNDGDQILHTAAKT